jgi:UMP-CMP kinase
VGDPPSPPVASPAGGGVSAAATHPTVVFVLGGPGAGKGTQCANIVRDFGFTHLSAGDLLRAHMKSGSADGNMVAEMIKQGQIVPSVVTVNLLLDAMRASGKNTFLIDGFPRNKENRDAWETTAGYDCDFVLFFDAPQDVMLQRLLGRDQGRSDDNETTIKLRFKTFEESSMPVVRYYEQKGKVNSVVATASPEAVYTATKGFFEKYK